MRLSGGNTSLLIEPSALKGELDIESIEKPVERAYQVIRRAILTGELPSGSHLREEALAQMTGTSRTPVREALGRLTAEGLARPENRSRFVADFSFEEVIVIFDIRTRLEGYAARLAATRIRDDEIARMTEIVDAIDELGDGQSEEAVLRFANLNGLFHAGIIEATHSTQLRTLSSQAVALPLEMIKKFVWEQPVNIRRSNAQHRDILGALAARNPEWAEASMSAHILSTRPVRKPSGI
ncbi:GntR family transcriptional regulator [Martelella limonii]|uniref:GntR family transcriptional regulator n=1 Tax=Martelella limonii TaxID=1647649 RepID=UPI0015812690|nr:GntR family transcriptional regulator [Martelella limonii]